MLKRFFILGLFCALHVLAFAQPRCGFDDVHEKRLRTDPKYKKEVDAINARINQYIAEHPLKGNRLKTTGTTYTIPVVVHVMHTGGEVGTIYNPSDQQILATIDYLNKVYNGTYPGTKGVGDLEIQFTLASFSPSGNCTNGIDRVNASSLPGYVDYGVNQESTAGVTDAQLKDLSKWSVSNYYNIWVVNKIDGRDGTAGSFIGGYAYLPQGTSFQYDGTVILATWMRPGAETLPHEIGHALSLYHTFQGASGSNCPPSSPCTTTGDYVCDTDPSTQSFSCRTGTNPCTGLPFNENTEENYMSYTGCDHLFTAGQKARLLAAMTLDSRKSLVSASNPAFTPCSYNDNCPGNYIKSDVSCSYLLNQSLKNATPSGKARVSCDPYSGTSPLEDVWYNFKASSTSHTITVDPAGSSLNAIVSVYEACSDNSPPIACGISNAEGQVVNLTVNSLTVGSSYYIRIYNNGGGTTNKGFKICATNPCVTPATPVNIVGNPTGQTTATISWASGSPAGSAPVVYYWVVGLSPSVTFGNGLLQGSTMETVANVTGLNCGNTYYVRVYAYTGCNKTVSSYGTSEPFTTALCPTICTTPGTPKIIGVGAGKTYANFQWYPSTPAGSATVTYKWVIGSTSTVTFGEGVLQGSTVSTTATAGPLECGKKYYLRVFATTSCDGSSSEYATTNFSTAMCGSTCPAPNAPINVTAIATGEKTARFSWSSASPAGSATETYSWEISKSPSFPIGETIASWHTQNTSDSTTLLQCGQTYYFRVYAQNDCNESPSPYSVSPAFTTSSCSVVCVTPAKPVNVTATAAGQTAATFTWKAGTPAGSSTVTYYWVVGTTPNITFGNGTAQGATRDSVVSVQNLSCGTTYYFRVAAMTSCNLTISDYTTSAAFSTINCSGGCIRPEPPMNVVASSTSRNSANLSWSAAPYTGSSSIVFDWVVCADVDRAWETRVDFGSTYSTTVSTSELYCGGTYYLVVWAVAECANRSSEAGVSQPFTTFDCATPGCITPAPPINLKTKATSGTTVDLSWESGNPPGRAHVIYYFVADENPNIEWGKGRIQGYTWLRTATISYLDCDKQYYFRVYALTDCDSSRSAYSTSAPFSTTGCSDPCQTPLEPVNPTVSATSRTTARLSWTAGAKVGEMNVRYHWYVFTDISHPYDSRVIEGYADTTFVNVANLTCGTKYYLGLYAFAPCNLTSSSSVFSEPFNTFGCGTGCVKPGMPLNLSVSSIEEKSVVASWSPPAQTGSPATIYYWVLSTSPDALFGEGIAQGSTPFTSITIPNLFCGNRYYLRVKTVTSCDGQSSDYLTIQFNTKECTPGCPIPEAARNLKATLTGPESAALSWSPPINPGNTTVTYYWAVVADTLNFYISTVAHGISTDTTATVSNLYCGGSYFLFVQTYTECNKKYGPWVNSREFFTAACNTACITPGAPTGLIVKPGSSNNVDVSWNAGVPKGTADVYYYWFVTQDPSSPYPTEGISGLTMSTSVTVKSLVCGIKYYFRVQAYSYCNSISTGFLTSPLFEASCSTSCLTPGAPTNLVSSPVSTSSVKLQWKPGQPGTNSTITYNWVVAHTLWELRNNPVAQGTTRDTSVIVNNLDCNKKYFFQVAAVADCDNSSSSIVSSPSFTPFGCEGTCTTPGAPTNLFATDIGSTNARLVWSAGTPAGSPNITYYWVAGRSPDVVYGEGVQQGTTTSNEVIISGLNCGSFYFRVFAESQCNNQRSTYSNWTSENMSCVSTCITPSTPVNLSGTVRTATTAILQWSAGSPVGSDIIYYYWVVGTTPDVTYGNGIASGISTALSAFVSNLTCNTTYYLRVYSYTTCNNTSSLYATSLPFTTPGCCITPAAPGNLTAATVSETTAIISWTPGTPNGSDTVHYYWVIGTTPDVTYGNGVASGITTGLSASVTNLLCNTKYYLRVYSYTTCNKTASQYTTSLPFTTPACLNSCITPAAPTSIIPVSIIDTAAKLSWSSGTPAGSATITYKWIIGTTLDVRYGEGIAQGETSSTTAPITGLTCGTYYYFKVLASTSCNGSASPYSITSFTTQNCSGCITQKAPANVAGKGIDGNTALLSWTAGTGGGSSIITYRWRVVSDTSRIIITTIATGTSTSTSVTISNLNCGGTYYLFVSAYTECNGSLSATVRSAPFATTPCPNGCATPGNPNNLKVTPTSANAVNISWEPGNPLGSADVVYHYFLGTDSLAAYGNAYLWGETMLRSTRITVLDCKKTYYFRIYASTTCNNTSSQYVSSGPFKGLGCDYYCNTPGTPTNLSTTELSVTSVKLSWEAGTPAGNSTVTYRWSLFKDSVNTNSRLIISGRTNLTSDSVYNLVKGATYHFIVTAFADCDSTNSQEATSNFFTLGDCVTPAIPINIKGTGTGATTAGLSWSAGTPAGTATVSYYWVVGTSPNVTFGNGVAQGITPFTNAPVSNLVCGVIYYLRVYAMTSCNQSSSDYGTSLAFTTDYSSCVTAVPNVPSLQDFQLMPNPNNGDFYVKLKLLLRKEVQFTVLDATGQTVFASPGYFLSGNVTKAIQLKGISGGVYFLRTRIGDKYITNKIVVAR